jgi:UDP-N-acetylglucosamine 2-epimerase (non-hydrolysing)
MYPVVIAGARPNFVKVAPLLHELERQHIGHRFLHTGQHYDEAMSDALFRDLAIPAPDANFGVGSGSHAAQTAQVMMRFDAWLDENPGIDRVIVVGDVNSTVACALVGAKRNLKVAHVEAGLRSGDRTMPEEINRIATDALSTWLLTPSPDADENLRREGAHPNRITLVGNIMVDSLFDGLTRLPAVTTVSELGLTAGSYGLATLHRASLVDDPAQLGPMLHALGELSESLPIVFPVHPRTRSRIIGNSLTVPASVHLVPPLGYLDFLAAQAGARLVLTDSGGVQEETTCLGVPCLTVRASTERPITVSEGTNRVVGTDPADVLREALRTLECPPKARRPELWDGHAAKRIVDALQLVPDEPWLRD